MLFAGAPAPPRARGAPRTNAARTLHPARLLLAALALHLLAAASLPRQARAQMQQPLQGNSDDPPQRPTKVYISVFLDRLLAVDDKSYDFEAVIFIYLSWSDPRVKNQIKKSQQKVEAGNHTCTLLCQSSGHASGGCCEDVWLPYIPMSNIKVLPQDRVYRYGFGFDEKSSTVFYWTVVHATWYTPMNFRAFPFDNQLLTIQLETPSVALDSALTSADILLIPSASGSEFFSSKGSGDDVSEWAVESLTLHNYSFPICKSPLAGLDAASAASDPGPLVPSFFANDPKMMANSSKCVEVARSPLAGYSPLIARSQSSSNSMAISMVAGVNVVIRINRLWSRHVISALFPVLATTWLGFLVFLLPRRDMEARLGAVVALFLALAAIQFVIDADLPASSYTTAMQMLTLVSYCVLILVGIENVLIWWLSNYHKSRASNQKRQIAQEAINRRMQQMLEQALIDVMVSGLSHQTSADADADVDARAAAARGRSLASKLRTLLDEPRRGSLTAKSATTNDPRHGVNPSLKQQQPQKQQQEHLQGQEQQDEGAEASAPAGLGVHIGSGSSPKDVERGPAAQPSLRPQQRSALLPQASVGAGGPAGPVRSCRAWPCALWERARTRVVVEMQALKEDPVYADRISHILNKWACVTQFIAYNICAVLVFVISAYRWRQ